MLNKVYQYVRGLSLDVAAGAAISARWISNYYQEEVPTNAIVCLSLVVWIIYTVDHLLDARHIKRRNANFRHILHKDYAYFIWGSVSLASVWLMYSVFQLKKEVFFFGIALGVFVILYFAFVHFIRRKPFWGKEWFIAIIYASGICLPALSYLEIYTPDILYFWIQIFLIAIINLLIFNMFELQDDRIQGFFSFATHFGFDITRRTILILFVLFVVLWGSSFLLFKSESFFDYQAILIFMASVLALILSKEKVMKTEEWYRILGDMVFLLPLIEILGDGKFQ